MVQIGEKQRAEPRSETRDKVVTRMDTVRTLSVVNLNKAVLLELAGD